MIEEMLSTVSSPFDKERQEFKALINKLRNKLNTSLGIIDKSLIEELERRVAKLEEKLQDISSFTSKEISTEIELLDKKVDELNVYFTLINKVKYIDKYIKEKRDITNEDLLGLVRMMTSTLDDLTQNKYFYLDSQEDMVSLTYTTIYKLIKKEILINHESLLLSVIKDDETSKSYICKLISDEIKEIFSGTYANLQSLENLKEVLDKNTDKTTSLLNKDVINAILIMNSYESLKSSYFKEYEATEEILNKDFEETKSILEKDIIDAIEDKKDKIRKLKENKRKTLLPTLFLASALLAIINNSLVLNDIEHNQVKYDTSTIAYSENIGTKQFYQMEPKLPYAINKKYESEEYGEYEYAKSKILEVCGEEYYDESGKTMYDYTLYNLNDFEFDVYEEYTKIDEDLLKDKIIESGTKEGTPEFKSEVTLKTQDVKSRTLDEPFKRKKSFSIFMLIFNALLNAPVQSLWLFSQIKDRLRIKSSIKETKNQISSLLNKCISLVEYNTNLSKLKELSKFLKTLSKIEPFTNEEENLLNIDSYLKEQKELEKKLTIFKNHHGN